MIITMKEGWLVKTMTNVSFGPDVWEFRESDPGYVPEMWDAAKKEHVHGEVKRIMFIDAGAVEVTQ